MNEMSKINDYELLSRKIYRVLKARIIKGNFKPEEKILEVNIAKQLGVSRTPVREALRELATEGFVETRPNLGVFVIGFSLEGLKETLKIRRVLEGEAAYIASKKINKEEIKKLEVIIKKMSISFSKPKLDVVDYSELNAEFHNLILSICGNKRLMKICANLSDSEHRFKIRSLRSNPERLKYSLKEHQEIVDALKEKDSIKAKKLSQVHIDNILKNILIYDEEKRIVLQPNR